MKLEQILLLVLLFLAVSLGIWGLALAFTRGSGLQSRLRTLIQGSDIQSGSQPDLAAGSGWSQSVVKAVVQPVSKLSTPGSEEEISRFRERFVRAGFRGTGAPLWFFASKGALALLLPLVYLLMERVIFPDLPTTTSLVLAFFAAAIGYYLPNYGLEILTRRRQREVLESFPDALDLMVVCVEAGLGLDIALARVAEEMEMRSPVLRDELSLVGLELRVGSSRERALTNFAVRTGLEEVSAFVTMLLQAERFGTSLADSLRVHADTLRTQRRLRAEEQAAKIALKMLFPLIFFIFPTLMLVLLGPAAIQIYRTMLPAM